MHTDKRYLDELKNSEKKRSSCKSLSSGIGRRVKGLEEENTNPIKRSICKTHLKLFNQPRFEFRASLYLKLESDLSNDNANAENFLTNMPMPFLYSTKIRLGRRRI